MAIVTYQGVLSSSPFPNGGYLQIAKAGIDTLELMPSSDGCRRTIEPGLRAAGRSIKGRLLTEGNDYKPTIVWRVTCAVTKLQMELFEYYLAVQNYTKEPVTLVDHFDKAISTTYLNGFTTFSGSGTNAAGITTKYGAWNVKLEADTDYKSDYAPGWHTLQFTALELI